MVPQAQSYADLFISHFRIVGRKIRWKIAFVMAGTTGNRTFKQPFRNAIFRATAHPADFAQ